MIAERRNLEQGAQRGLLKRVDVMPGGGKIADERKPGSGYVDLPVE